MVVPGKVYVLSDEVGVHQHAGALAFVSPADPAGLIAALPPADSAVLMLSGANEAMVEASLALAEQGGWLAGQSIDGSYDPRRRRAAGAARHSDRRSCAVGAGACTALAGISRAFPFESESCDELRQ